VVYYILKKPKKKKEKANEGTVNHNMNIRFPCKMREALLERDYCKMHPLLNQYFDQRKETLVISLFNDIK
jgi:hypothetical protein